MRARDLRRDWMGYYGHARNPRRACGARAGRTITSLQDLRDLADSLSSGDLDEPADLLYATAYPHVAAQFYGPSVLVLGPDREGRGLDLGYYSAVSSRRAAEGNSSAPLASCSDVRGALEVSAHLFFRWSVAGPTKLRLFWPACNT